MTFLLCLVFFLSGAAALLFETLWFHQAGLALGNSVWSASLVLAGFMGGLALGNGLAARLGHRVRRRVRAYALLELAIGASGLALVHLLPALIPALVVVFRPFLDAPWILNGLRLVIALVLLLLPSTAMGATLPLLVAELFRRDPHFGRVLGRLYGWNTLGAVVGALAGHVALIEWFGIRGSGLAAALANGVAALLALGLASSLEAENRDARGRPDARRPPLSGRALHLLAAAFLCGGILLALEVVWFRFLSLFMLAGSLAFALMLAIVLAGIALGGLLGARWFAFRPHAQRHLPAVALTSAALCVLTYRAFDGVASRFGGRPIVDWTDMLSIGVPLMFPVALLSGVLFTLLGEALNREAPAETRSAGMLALANTTGAMLGSLAGGFLLLPGLGIERSIQLCAVGYCAGALLMALGGVRPQRVGGGILLGGAAVLVLLCIGLLPTGLMKRSFLQYPIQRFASQGSVPVVIRESLTETVIYMRRNIYGEVMYHRLLTNMTSCSSTMTSARRYMKLFVYWPIAVHPNPRHALLISYGVGMTAKALTDTRQLETIDIVDISKDILDLSSVVFVDPKDSPLEDPRVTVHVEDGRFFLQTTEQRFDLITGEPPPPKAAGIVNLFTKEYFQLLRDRLADGGIATYWLPVHSLLEHETKAIIRAFCEAFEDCSLWGSRFDWMLVGTRGARGPVSAGQFARQWRDPVVGPDLRALGFELPEQFGALFLADADDLRELTRDTPPLDDDHPKRLGRRATVARRLRRVYAPWMDVELARERFRASSIVKRLWPEPLRTTSLDYFPHQEVINGDALRDRGDPISQLRTVHRLLTTSPLRTLVLWQLGRNDSTQRAARRALAKGRRSAALDYELGIGALADRNFPGAADRFRKAAARGARQRTALYYRLYALCLAGRLDEARELADRSGLTNGERPTDRAMWRFLTERFALGAVGPTS